MFSTFYYIYVEFFKEKGEFYMSLLNGHLKFFFVNKDLFDDKIVSMFIS